MKKILLALLLVCAVFVFNGCFGGLAFEQNLTEYTINLEYNDTNKSLKCNQTVDYINKCETTLKNIKFHLYANAFREEAKAKVVSSQNQNLAYPNGKSYGDIQIKQVKIEDMDIKFDVCGEDKNILNIPLKQELFPDDRIKIYIEYDVKLANINHRLGYGESAVNICNFYPIACIYENGDFVCDLYNSNGDPFYSEVANYNVKISYPNQFKLASTGNQIETTTQQQTTTKIQAKCVRDFALVLSNNFSCENTLYDNRININYYYYNDEKPEQTISLINQVLKFFENKIGEYPYNSLTICETNFVHGGMEYPNLVLISDCLADYETYQMVVIHEICHQWWYGVVGNNQYDYGWIDEGLTEFCTLYFYEKHPEYKRSIDTMVQSSTNAYITFMRVYKDVLGNVDTSMNRPLNKFSTEPEYVYNTYVKGMLMFATIYEVVGEKSFDNALKYYYKHNAYKISTPDIIIKCFCKGSGKDLSNLFDSWLNGKVVILNK